MSDQRQTVETHYAGAGLVGRLQDALAAAGLGDGAISPAALAPLDQFHTRGLPATIDLAEAAELRAGMNVLDVGSGLGGPSRYLAATYDVGVTGIDLSPAFVDAATYLAARAGLAGRVEYRVGDALALPFASDSFDRAWTQHVAMNIADRATLYAGIARVLKPGGRLAAYDVVAGSGEALHFPVPWSRGPETSFLLAPDAMRTALETAGFRILSWVDRTADAVAWNAARRAAGPGALGLQLAMGPDFPAMAANLGRNLVEGRVGIAEVIAEQR